jgi:hypothetical protein
MEHRPSLSIPFIDILFTQSGALIFARRYRSRTPLQSVSRQKSGRARHIIPVKELE